jgi:hypothetical protein
MNNFKWSAEPLKTNVRTRKHNLITHLSDIIGPAKQKGNYCAQLSAWELLFTDEVLKEIILPANEELS